MTCLPSGITTQSFLSFPTMWMARGECQGMGVVRRGAHWQGACQGWVDEGSISEDGRSEDGCGEDGYGEDGCSEDGCSEDGCSEERMGKRPMGKEGAARMGAARSAWARGPWARRVQRGWVQQGAHGQEAHGQGGCSQRHSACIEMSHHVLRCLSSSLSSLVRQTWTHHGQLDKPYLVMHKLGVTVKFAIISVFMGCVHIAYLQMVLRLPCVRVSYRSWKYGGQGAVGRHWVGVGEGACGQVTQVAQSPSRHAWSMHAHPIGI